jgi:RHS repeat-associated protein
MKAVRARIYANGALVDSFLDEDPQPNMVWENAGLTTAEYYDRAPNGRQRVEVELSHGYEPVFYASPSEFEASFGVSQGESEFSADRRNDVIWRTKRWSASLANLANGDLAIPNPPGLENGGIGGWTLSPHHTYDPNAGILWRGDGVRREIPSPLAISPIVSSAEKSIQSAAVAPDGSIYLLSTNWSEGGQYGGGELTSILYRTSPQGNQTVVSESISCSDMGSSQNSDKCSGDAPLSVGEWTPANAVLIDERGQLFVVLRDLYANSEIVQRLYRIAPNGNAQGLYTFREGSPWQIPSRNKRGVEAAQALEATERGSEGCALIGIEARDGRIYFGCSEYGGNLDYPTIGMVWADGSVSHIAGGTVEVGTEPQPAIDAAIERPRGLAVAEDGSVFFSTYNQIWRISQSGILSLYAGSSGAGGFEERQPRLEASFSGLSALEVAPDGSLYLLDSGHGRVRVIDQNDLVRTVVGGGGLALDQVDEKVPAQSVFDLPWSSDAITFGPDGALHLTEQTAYGYGGAAVFRVARDVPRQSAGENEIEIVSSNGSQLYIFDDGGRHLRTLDVLTGAIVYEFEYDNQFKLTGLVDAYGREYVVERNGSSIDVRSPFGVETSISVNQDGYLETLSSPESRQWMLNYSSGGILAEVVEPESNSTTFSYGLQAKLTAHSVAGQADWGFSQYESDNGTRNVRKISGTGDETVYSSYTRGAWAGFGRVKKTWYPDGSTQLIDSRPDFSTSITTRSGVVVESREAADERFGFVGSVLESASITQAGKTQTMSFGRQIVGGSGSPLGQQDIVEYMSINEREYLTEYSSDIRRLTTTSPEGRRNEIRFNSKGKASLVQVGQLAPIHLEYDPYGRLIEVTRGSGPEARTSTLSYNSDGYLSEIEDFVGRATSWNRDLDGSLSSISLPGPRQIAIGRDMNGNIESVAPPQREAHELQYDQADRVTHYTLPVVVGSASPAQYEYDNSHRLVRYERQDGQSIKWIYNNGNVDRIESPDGDYQYFWSAGGRPHLILLPGPDATEIIWSGDLVTSVEDDVSRSTVEYQYDENFWIDSIAVNSSAVPFAYDDDGLPTQAGDLSLSYDQLSPLLDSTSLGLVSDSWSHNSFGEPDGYSASFGTQPLLDFTYQRDQLGRIEQVSEALGSGSPIATEYNYDHAGRLTTVRVDGAVTHEYEYDANGNRILTNGVSATYDEQDRLLSYGDWEYSYTADGELQERTDASTGESRSFDYDVFGNLDRVVLEDGTEITYEQDGLMRRASRSVHGVVTHRWAYQDQLNPVAELDAAGNVVSRFVYASKANVPDYMVQGGQTYRIISDHLGSVRLVVDVDSGAVAQEMRYGPFGKVLLDTNPGFQPFGFAGGLYDPLTGLVRFGARDYDASIGRWLSKDPIGFRGGTTNLYEYVGSDPVNRIDPTGKFGIFGAGVGAVIGGVGGFVGALASGEGVGSAIVEGVVGAAGGAVAGLIPGGGLIRSALLGGSIGGGSNAIAQGYNIWRDDCKSLRNDFNYGAVAGSAVGGALSGGIHSAAPPGVEGQLTTAGRDFAFGLTFGAVGAGLGQ